MHNRALSLRAQFDPDDARDSLIFLLHQRRDKHCYSLRVARLFRIRTVPLPLPSF